MENILILLVTVVILIFIEITQNEKIRKLEREMRIEKMKEHIKNIELLSKDITDMSDKIQKFIDNNKI